MPSPDDVTERQALQGVGSSDVFVRAAKVTDAAALIKLNEEFRENMLRWQQEDDDAEYPVLDFDDVEFILTEEDNQNLIVLCEKQNGGSGGRRQARIIGYSYAYDEPWEVKHETSKQNKGNGKGKQKVENNTSLYIAEVFSCFHLMFSRNSKICAFSCRSAPPPRPLADFTGCDFVFA